MSERDDGPVRTHTLGNGLVLVAEAMPGVRSAAVHLLLPAGAVHDPGDRLGLAALVADWLVRGAGGRDGRALLEAFDHLGATHHEGAQGVHASLSAATLGRNLLPTLDLIADLALAPDLDPEELEPLRALALQSLASLEDDPASRAVAELRKIHYGDPWGRYPGGTPEGVEAVTAEDARHHHARQFRPAGAILAVAGAIDWPALRDHVEARFGAWSGVPEPPAPDRPAPTRRAHLHRDTQQTQIALEVPAVTVTDPAYYHARAVAAILGGYASARLFTEVREKRGLCYSVSADYEGFRDRAAILCHAGSSPERAQETLDVMLAELRRLARDGIDRDELDTMRAGLKTALVFQQESTSSRAASLASDTYFLGRVRPVAEITAAFDALDPESVAAHAATLPLDRLSLVTLGPAPLSAEC